MRVFSQNSLALTLLLIIIVCSASLAGCIDGRFSPSSWDGLTVSGDTLYACSDGKFLALDLSDDMTIRDFTPGDNSESSSFLGCTSSSAPELTAYSAPVVSGSVFYTGTYTGEVYALDAKTGARKWEPYDTGKPIVGAPAISGNEMIIASGDKLYKLNIETGRPAWEEPFDTGGKIWSTPVIAEGIVYFGNLDHKLYAVDLETKEKLWEKGFDGAIASTALIVEDTLYIGTLNNKFYALDIADKGESKWVFKADNWIWTQAAFHEGTVYFGSFGGKVYALDAKTGQSKWSRPYDTGTGDRLRSAPAIAGEVLLVGSQDDHVYGLRLEDGLEAWAPLYFDDDIMADPYVSGTKVYFLDKDDIVYAVNAEHGSQVWSKQLELD